MIADALQDFFDWSKLQRLLEVSPSHAGSQIWKSGTVKQSLLNSYYVPDVICQEVVHKNNVN